MAQNSHQLGCKVRCAYKVFVIISDLAFNAEGSGPQGLMPPLKLPIKESNNKLSIGAKKMLYKKNIDKQAYEW